MKRMMFWLLVLVSLGAVGFAADATPGTENDTTISSVEERRILVSVEQERAKLLEREKEVDGREMQLKTLEGEVDKKLAEMQSLRTELLNLIESNKQAEQKVQDLVKQVETERISELSLMYEKMSPQKAAILLKDLDQDVAVGVLLGLKKKSAGKILDSLDAETAIQLSSALTEIDIPDTQ